MSRNNIEQPVLTYGLELATDMGPLILDYYLGVYRPWLTDRLPGFQSSESDADSDYDISFTFPCLFVQDVAVAYRFKRFRFLTGTRVMANDDLGYFFAAVFGQVSFALYTR